ncbi:hypothetical protein J6590_059318 [Homalodisca vitripennis]|nr:hypothetical protein J6590_059318 [Homalodisca vitripennis]
MSVRRFLLPELTVNLSQGIFTCPARRRLYGQIRHAKRPDPTVTPRAPPLSEIALLALCSLARSRHKTGFLVVATAHARLGPLGLNWASNKLEITTFKIDSGSGSKGSYVSRVCFSTRCRCERSVLFLGVECLWPASAATPYPPPLHRCQQQASPVLASLFCLLIATENIPRILISAVKLINGTKVE